jgi:hypothetical protein
MQTEDHSDFSWVFFKVFIMWAASHVVHNYHEIAGNILVTLSILFLIWKWRKEVKKYKKTP